ncbi:FAD binding domain-containing protein [Lentzea pudingi]|uniref:FAD binding domain-containing protein n=1 Tax=Lentzea pudingi TaxID=1789439 RepID=UPI0016690A60|nr:FAD binding domain-containing protein [Lentzea pudingi]
MKPPPFTYHRPATRFEVDELLGEYGADAKLLAGGQSLVPMLNMRQMSPAHVIDLGGLVGEPSVPVWRGAESTLWFGPLVRHVAVEKSRAVLEGAPLLSKAMDMVAHPPVRSRGTFVGAIAHADPASELPAVLVLLGGQVRVRSHNGIRTLAGQELYAGPFELTIAADEWIDEVRLPPGRRSDRFAIEEFTRRDADFAVCGVAATVREVGDVLVTALAFFGVGATPRRFELSAMSSDDITGGQLDLAVRELVAARLEPHDDIHATAAFRRHLAERLAVRAVRRAATSERSTE